MFNSHAATTPNSFGGARRNVLPSVISASSSAPLVGVLLLHVVLFAAQQCASSSGGGGVAAMEYGYGGGYPSSYGFVPVVPGYGGYGSPKFAKPSWPQVIFDEELVLPSALPIPGYPASGFNALYGYGSKYRGRRGVAAAPAAPNGAEDASSGGGGGEKN